MRFFKLITVVAFKYVIGYTSKFADFNFFNPCFFFYFTLGSALKAFTIIDFSLGQVPSFFAIDKQQFPVFMLHYSTSSNGNGKLFFKIAYKFFWD